METYNGTIQNIDSNQIFVFGSNTQGRHGKGSALFAKNKCGAIYGQAKGLQGNSYAIITKDLTKYIHPSISEEFIIEQINELYEYANNNLDKEFIVAYSGVGSNLNAYKPIEMAKFFNQKPIPTNIVFEEEFYNLIQFLKQ